MVIWVEPTVTSHTPVFDEIGTLSGNDRTVGNSHADDHYYIHPVGGACSCPGALTDNFLMGAALIWHLYP